MSSELIALLAWIGGIAAIVVLLLFASRVRREGGASTVVGAGTLHDILPEDKRKALQVIVEERAAATDPETADGKGPTD